MRDDDGQPRLLLSRPRFAEMVELAIGQPRRYGAGDHQVVRRLFLLLVELAMRCPADQRPVVRGQVERLRAVIAREDYDESERGVFVDLGHRVEHLLRDRDDVSA